jgi:PIN domain nuclease of toxin-antitoxin system
MLLDTHTALWFSEGIELTDAMDRQITLARNQDAVRLSVVTIWEIGNLIRKGRGLKGSLAQWAAGFMEVGGISIVDLTTEIVLDAAALPGRFHADPADRFLVATARTLHIPIVTRDKRILDYAKAGHVRALKC